MAVSPEERLRRSHDADPVDFASIPCADVDEPLVRVEAGERIVVEPIWLSPDDVEGRLYRAYIAEHPEYDGIYVRAGVLRRLERAAESLPDDVQLVVRAGHRPLEVQRQLLHDVRAEYAQAHSDASDEETLAHARTYVSDPDVKLPPHCCGAAVDVELRDTETGRLLDFGSPMNADARPSHLHHPDLTHEQAASRMLLLTAMLEAGFASYHAEWWHYSYGDQLWAWFYGEECRYGVARL